MTQQVVSLYLTGLQHFKTNKKAIPSPMFNYHSLTPWGSFRGRQEEKWGSFRSWDHFRVDLGIISGSGSAGSSRMLSEDISTVELMRQSRIVQSDMQDC